MAKNKSSHTSKKHTPKRQTLKRQQRKERGFWLTALLVIGLVRNIIGGIAVYALRSNPDESASATMISLLVILAIADIVAFIGMWLWKKWGFYLFLISSVGSGIIGLVMTGLFYMVFHAILPPAILGYIIRVQNKWKFFD